MATQVMLLTGCASGIGWHLAHVMARQGHHLLLTDIHLEALQAAAEREKWSSEQVLLRCLDVRDPDGWAEMVALAVEKWGRLDVVMNIAGIMQPAYIPDITPQQVELSIDVNLKGVILGTQAAAAQMVKQGYGHIINIASLAGLSPVPGLAVYAASKFAVRGFSLSAAHELRDKGVYVSVICPDAVQTPMLDAQLEYDEAMLTFSGNRLLTVEEVAAAIQTVLRTHALEIALPRYRAWLAKLASVLPRLGFLIKPLIMRQGRINQAKLRSARQT